ncbi:glycosyltransferase family 2 protein [Pontibacter cellulosilyticus]|uniref:Glycosyltransferase family 2 protein n=1 Tax=Pontibacter cellulosilyticus TaxID=1720253 RepID=A0A923N3A8_9BACT|nr:glycosyltransferase family 2 protein [Pontibacter cellulosilyticus]MBC5992115.1 glycosyltransferase family 2 protein [Pontibacter cellulosilyticus]
MYKYDIAASIVAYKNNHDIINAAVRSFLDTNLEVAILIIDNSPSDILKQELINDERVFYRFNGNNVGFSKAHNQGIQHFKDICKYFLVLNPDVYFDGITLSTLYNYLESHPDTGLIAPKVLYPNGDIQTSRRLIPSPIDLFIRRMPFGKSLFSKRTDLNEYSNCDHNAVIEVPFLLGCFMLFRTSAINEVGMFDERYFVYLEDLDICRRFTTKYKVIYYGQAKIYHLYQRASSKHLSMLMLHTVSMVKYFNKWGWISDKERKKINKKAVALIQESIIETPVSFSRKYAATL